MKDSELDALIGRFQNLQPTKTQFDRWSKPFSTNGRQWRQLAMGLAAGLVIGFLTSNFFDHKEPSSDSTQAFSQVQYFYHSPQEVQP